MDLLRFVPNGNISDGQYQTVQKNRDRVDQITAKWDYKINDRQSVSAYYYVADDTNFNPFSNFQAAGANVPGFGGNLKERFQQVNLSHTWTLSNNLVNEGRVVLLRPHFRPGTVSRFATSDIASAAFSTACHPP